MKHTTTLPVPNRYSAARKWLIPLLAMVALALILIYFYNRRAITTGSGSAIAEQMDVSAPAPRPEAKKDLNVLALYREKMTHIINGDSSGKWTINDNPPL